MDWMVAIGEDWLKTLGWMAGLAVAFGALARLMPCNPGMFWWKHLRTAGSDFLYWFVVPLFVRVCRTLILIAGVILLFGGKPPEFLPVKGWPLWQQCLACLFLTDVLQYGAHRLFHTRRGWKYHAIHHSPEELDWTSAARFHPVNNLLTFALAEVVVLLLGFSPEALVALAPFNIVYSALVHANLNWTFGPLRYVFASPVFHRWHHSTEKEGLDKNFASTFPLLDLVFGTFYMPPGKLPVEFGSGEPDFPHDFWGQFTHPFGRKRRPLLAGLIGAALVAGVGLVGGTMYQTAELAELAESNAQRAREAERAAFQSFQALPGQASPILSVAIGANGSRIVSASEDGTARVSDSQTGQEKLTLTGHARPIRSVAISADGNLVVSGSYDKTVKVWDAQKHEVRTFTGHSSAVLAVAISANGLRIVSASADGTARVWGPDGQEKLVLPQDTGAIPSVAISADGWRIVTASGRMAKVWDGHTGKLVRTLEGHTDLVYSVAIGPGGALLATGSFDQTVRVWDGETGQQKLALKGHAGPVYSVAIGPAGKSVVSGGSDKTVRVWDAQTGQQQFTLAGHEDDVTSVAVSADGNRIVSGSRDGTMKMWDARTGASREKIDLTRRD